MLGGETGPCTPFIRWSRESLGLGAIAIYPLAKKFGIRMCPWRVLLVLLGSVMGWMFPTNLPVALAAGFLRQTGMIPNCYIFATLLCYAFDSVEFKSGLRLEGLMGTAIIAAIQAAIYAPFAGGYESSLLKLGFVDAVGVAEARSYEIHDHGVLSVRYYVAVMYLVCCPLWCGKASAENERRADPPPEGSGACPGRGGSIRGTGAPEQEKLEAEAEKTALPT